MLVVFRPAPHELTQANLRVLQYEEQVQRIPTHPPVASATALPEGESDAQLRADLAAAQQHLSEARAMRVTQAHSHHHR
eukprot:791382-Amphidinium_carterae.1